MSNDSVRERLKTIEDRQGRMELTQGHISDKLDFLVSTSLEQKANIAMACDLHRRKTDKIIEDVDSLKTWRTSLTAAWGVASFIGIMAWEHLRGKIK